MLNWRHLGLDFCCGKCFRRRVQHHDCLAALGAQPCCRPGSRQAGWLLAWGDAPFGHPGRSCLLRAGSLFCRDVLRGNMVVFPSLCFPQSFSCSPTPKSHPCSPLKTHSTLQPQCHLPVSRLSTFVPDSSCWAPSPSSFTFQPCLLT